MTPAYTSKLGFFTRKTSIGAQKIKGSAFNYYGIVIAELSLQNKLGKIQFFKKPFLLVDISMEVVLEMPFLCLSDSNIRFVKRKIIWRRYTAVEALPTTQRIKFINKKKFAAAVLDANNEIFIIAHSSPRYKKHKFGCSPFWAA